MPIAEAVRRNGRSSMQSPATLLQQEAALGDDPRWQLIERITASQTFGKTTRSSQFLSFVCERTLIGRADEINEQTIGESVFGRAAGYDPGQDNIVRVQASRLRQKLETYFHEEGASEALRVIIPKGGYTPQFEATPTQLPVHEKRPSLVETPDNTVLNTVVATPLAGGKRRWLYILLLCILCPAVWELAYLRYEGPGASISLFGLQLIALPKSPDGPLWRELFQRGQTTLIVPCDSGLVLYERQSSKSVDLAQYLSGEGQAVPVINTSDSATNKANYRYTSIVDLQVASQLMALPEAMQGQTQIRYARDLKLDDLKGNNIILVGAKEANPWVELFEQHMNFAFDDKRDTYDFVVTNKSPQPGEAPTYKMVPSDPAHRAYALVALLPNLNGTGKVLIVEGSTMAGTDAASDFAFDGTKLASLLQPYIRHKGKLPYFEVLLQTSNIGGSAPDSKVVAYRIHQD